MGDSQALTVTGVFDRSGPSPKDWDAYKAVVIAAWDRLLERDDVDEATMHRFLERYPCLLPFSYQSTGSSVIQGHHGSVDQAVYSKPRLAGRAFEPDFMRITWDSSWIHVYLIEIEDPRKSMFTKGGDLSAAYKHARGQLTDWVNWFGDSTNALEFRKRFGLDHRRYASRDLRLQRILVYGRRSEVEANARGRQARQDDEGIESMTYDRLAPSEEARQDVTVQMKKGRLTVKYVPPTFELGPVMMVVLGRFSDWEAAISRSDDIDDDRKAFLIRRIPYWSSLARTHQGAVMHNRDSWE